MERVSESQLEWMYSRMGDKAVGYWVGLESPCPAEAENVQRTIANDRNLQQNLARRETLRNITERIVQITREVKKKSGSLDRFQLFTAAPIFELGILS